MPNLTVRRPDRASLAATRPRPPPDLLVRRDEIPAPARVALLLGLALVAASRSWYLVGRGRFWAEEGTQYFARMAATDGPSGLWYAQTRAGYTNLVANVGTWVAARVPLALAPLVTVWTSFAVVLALVWVALAWPSELLPTARSKAAAAILLVVGTLALPEVWLNTINAQVHLALIAVLLLFVRIEDVSRRRFLVGIGLLAVAGLSGVYASVLAPMYVAAAWRRGGSRRWAYAVTLCTTAVIQLAIYLSARSAGLVNSKRSVVPELGDGLRGLGGWQLTGLVLPYRATGTLISSQIKGGSPLLLVVIASVVVAVLVAILRTTTRPVAFGLLGSFLLVEVVVQAGAIGGVAGGRYAVVPIGISTLALVHGAAVARRRSVRHVARVGVGIVGVVGLLQFWSLAPATLRCIGCPAWSDEVARWQRGEIAVLEIWPYDRKAPWTVELPPAPPEPPAS